MSRREKARAGVSSTLHPGEEITAFGHVRIKNTGAWVAVTDRRLMLLARVGRTQVGQLLFDAPRHDVSLSRTSGMLHRVTIEHAATGQPIGRLDFGLSRSDAAAVVEAAAEPVTGEPTPAGPEGDVTSLRPGERLPDGRVLSASEWLRAVQEGSGRYR